jgi:hypothetical protein
VRNHPKGRNKIQDSWNAEPFKILQSKGDNVYVVEPAVGLGNQRTLNRAEIRACPRDWWLPVNKRTKPATAHQTRQVKTSLPDSSFSDTPEIRIYRRQNGVAQTQTEQLPADENPPQNSSGSDEFVPLAKSRPKHTTAGINPNPYNLPTSAVKK